MKSSKEALCCCCFDRTSLVRPGKRGLAEEDAVEEDGMEQPKGDGEEKDVPKMEGYMEKKGKSRLVSSWRKYWFVLDGRRLTYYESQPHPSVELPPSCKGFLTIAPATSVTASKQAAVNGGAGHQPSHMEIYILSSSRMVTLRTKDADQHESWLKALVASTKLPLKAHTANGSNSPKTVGSTSVFPLRPSTKYFRYSLTNLSSQEEKQGQWPKNMVHLMDSRSCSLYQRKSGSMDDILDRYADQTKESSQEANVSDSEEEETEEVTSKGESPESNDLHNVNTSLEFSLPVIDHEIPPARLHEHKERDLVQKKERLEELSALAIEDWDTVHQGTHADEKYIAENDLSRYIEITGHQSMKQSDPHEGKMKARRFLTSLVSKDSRIFEGIYRGDKGPKKEKQTVAQDRKGMVTQSSSPDKNEKSKVKHKQTPGQLEGKDRLNEGQRAQRAISLNEASQSGSSVRSSIIKKTAEFRTARRAKRNKDKKKRESTEVDPMDESHEPSFSRQNSQKERVFTVAPLLDENDLKKKRRKISFLTKMLRGKKSDDPEEVADRYEILQDLPFDSAPNKYTSVHNSYFTEDGSSPQTKPGTVIPHISFKMKLIPGDDTELRKKLESRMAQIESEMAMASENGNIPGPVPPRMTDAASSLSVEGAGQIDDRPMSMEGAVSSPPPVLPPRLIKLTPPTPPAHTTFSQGDENLGDSSPDLLEGFLRGITSKDFPFPMHSSELNLGGKKNEDEIILCDGGESEWKGSFHDGSLLSCDQSAAIVPESLLPSDSNNGERNGPGFQSEVSRITEKVSDVGVHDGLNTSNTDGRASVPRLSWESDRHQDMGVSVPLCGDGVSSVQSIHSSSVEPLQRTSGHLDELSLLLTELDRINASPLYQDVSRQNHRPVSDEVKKTSTFEEDFIRAFPIRRRRNSDPDYDIPRPHRIPHLQETKEESPVIIMSAASQKPERKASFRENTDSIVIEATRFFGPGMDFSFNEKKYSALTKSEDLWDYPYDCENRDLDYTNSDYFYGGNCGGPQESKNGSEFSDRTVKEPSGPIFSETNSSDGKSVADKTKAVDEQEDNNPKLRDRLEVTGDEESVKVVLRGSSMDRACRKERSREIYDEDLTDQFELNGLLEGLSISSKLECADESLVIQCKGGSDGQTPDAEGQSNTEKTTLGLLNQESSPHSNQECHNVDITETSELNNSNVTVSNGSASEKTLELDTQPDSMTASALDGAGHVLDDHENEVVLRSKPDSSSREDSKAYRLSFATTETLLVEEEVLVATLKTTTTTTTFLPLEDGSNNTTKENVEEFVEEIVLDMDQLSDDQFDSMQVHSCVQT